MPNLPDHFNRFTGERLANAVEVCPECHSNFNSTKAGDQHRATINGVRVCLTPEEAGLELTVNRFQAIIYRTPLKPALAGIRDTFIEAEVNPSKELSKSL
jgi:hypothetical protein